MAGETERTVSIIIKAQDQAASVLENLVTSFASVQGAALLAAAAVAGAAYAFAKITDAAMEQETADVHLAAALRSIGQNTTETRGQLIAFAEQMEEVTGVNHKAIEGAEGLIAQLAHLSGSALQDATKTALGLSAAMGVDLQSAATMVARAAEGNVTSFKRFGIVLDDTLPKSQRGAAALKVLAQTFGDTATAMGGTLETAFHRLANDFGNLEEALGAAIVKNDTFRALLAILNDLFKDATKFVKDHEDVIQNLTTAISRAIVWVIQFGVENVNAAVRSAQAWATLFEFILAMAVKAVTAVPKGLRKFFGFDEEDVQNLLEKIGGFASVIEKVREGASSMGDATDEALQQIIKHLAEVGTKGHDVAAALGPGFVGPTQQLSELDQLLKDMGQETMAQLAATSEEVNQVLKLLPEALAAGTITEDQYNHILETITEITKKLPDWMDDQTALRSHAINIADAWGEIRQAIDDQATESLLRFSDTTIEAANGASVAWGQFMKQLLADFEKAIARALILKLVSGMFTGGGDGFSPTDLMDLGLTPEAAAVPITPASIVLPGAPVSSAPGLESRALNTQPGAGPSPSGLIQMFNQIVPQRGREADIADMIRDINRAVERHGMRLVASHVLA